MTPQLLSFERWLIADEPVMEALRAESLEPDGLLELRLNHGLIDCVPHQALGARIAQLTAAGFYHFHVVAERVDVELVDRLRPLVCELRRIELHDWYRAPHDILASLDAPDTLLVEHLSIRARSASSLIALVVWPPIEGFVARANGNEEEFLPRLRRGLACWERQARLDHARAFSQEYGRGRIPWQKVLPAPRKSPPPRIEPGAWIRALVRLVAAPLVREPAAGLAHAMSQGAMPMSWSYTIAGAAIDLLVALPSRSGANVEVYVTLGRGQLAPSGFELIEDGGQVLIAAATDTWVESDMDGEARVSYHAIPDEFGELRARFQALRAQPDLRLLPGPPST